MAAKLYMIPCPIGDEQTLGDVLPAGNNAVIAELDYFIVENLRSARRFLSKTRAAKPIDSLRFAELNEHTKPQELEAMIAPILGGMSAGVISEAGVPGVADPGADIVALCHRKGIEVVPLVGPCSIVLALMASGLSGQNFAFNGYIPVKGAEKTRAIKDLEQRAVRGGQSQVFIEAPYRNERMLEDLLAACAPTTMLTIAVDILEPSQFIRTKSMSDWRKNLPTDINKRPAIFILGAVK